MKKQASQQQRRMNVRTFLALDSGCRILGYCAMLTYQLDLDQAALAFGLGKRKYPIRALLLARLAVDSSAQGRGVGRLLLRHAMENAAEISTRVGVEVLVVHAIDEEAATFYARYGFGPFEGRPLHLFIAMKHVLKTLEL